MIDITNTKKIYLFSEPIDFRYRILGLSAIITSKFNLKQIEIDVTTNFNHPKLEMRKDKLYQLTKKVYDDALNEIIDSETSSKMIKEYQEEQKKIISEIETLKNLKQEEESTIENYKLLK